MNEEKKKTARDFLKTLTPQQRMAYHFMQMAKTLGIQNYDASGWKDWQPKKPVDTSWKAKEPTKTNEDQQREWKMEEIESMFQK